MHINGNGENEKRTESSFGFEEFLKCMVVIVIGFLFLTILALVTISVEASLLVFISSFTSLLILNAGLAIRKTVFN